MQREGRERARDRWTMRLLMGCLLALAVAAPQVASAQGPRFAVAGHGVLVATGEANADLRVLREGTSSGFGPALITGVVPEGTVRPSGGVAGRFEILPIPNLSTGLLVSYAQQHTAIGPDVSWRDVDAWLAVRLPAEVGARQLSVVPYLAVPVGLSIMVGRLGGSNDRRRFGWNVSTLLGLEVEGPRRFAVYMEAGWQMRQVREEQGSPIFGDYRITLTTHQFVVHLGVRGSRGR